MKLKHIKDQFNMREIAPSDGAWDKLSARLDQEEKGSSKKPVIYWLSAIAAVLLIALIASPFLQSNMSTPAMDSPSVVMEDGSLDEVEAVESNNEKQVYDKPQITSDPVIKNRDRAIAQRPAAQKQENKIAQELSIIPSAIKNDAIAAIDQQEKKSLEDAVDVQEEIKTNKIDPATEADLLLNAALNNFKEVNTAVASNKVNALKLLRETEWDLEAEQQDRLQNTVKDGLLILKREAVAYINRKD